MNKLADTFMAARWIFLIFGSHGDPMQSHVVRRPSIVHRPSVHPSIRPSSIRMRSYRKSYLVQMVQIWYIHAPMVYTCTSKDFKIGPILGSQGPILGNNKNPYSSNNNNRTVSDISHFGSSCIAPGAY